MELNINISHEDDLKSGGLNIGLFGSDKNVMEVADYLMDCKVNIKKINDKDVDFFYVVDDPDLMSAILNKQIFLAYVFHSASGKRYTGDESWNISHTGV